MMNETLQTLFGLFGGLAIFLFGMNQMSDALQKAAGERMKKILAMFTSHPVKGALAGALVTAVLQSSSATTVMTIGFVSAGLMSLPQAISVIFGANIGTTMTAQLIAFDISDYIYPIIFVGFLINFMAKKEKAKSIGMVILSFGLLFLGISTMSSVMAPLAKSPVFIRMLENVKNVPVLGVLVGLCMTLVVQSSSATIAVLQNFAAQAGPDGHSLLGLAGAIPVLLGDNIGTTITALLASIGQSRNAKRTAIAHSLFNISGTMLFIWFIKPYAALIRMISPKGAETAIISRQIANAHTGFNLTMTLIWIPLIALMVKIVMKILPLTDEEKRARMNAACLLDESLPEAPSAIVSVIYEDRKNLTDCVGVMLRDLVKIFNNPEVSLADDNKNVRNIYQITYSHLQILMKKGLAEEERRAAKKFMYTLCETENICHIALDIERIVRNDQSQGHTYSSLAVERITKSLKLLISLYFDSLIREEPASSDVIKRLKTALECDRQDITADCLTQMIKGYDQKAVLSSYEDIIADMDRMVNGCRHISDAHIINTTQHVQTHNYSMEENILAS